MNESTLVPREAMSDLDWLARNVHVWPSATPKIYPAGCKEFTNGAIFHDEYMILGYDIEITKCQWLARRAGLQNKPVEWPINANWLAQDAGGGWSFYTDSTDSAPQCHGESVWYSDDEEIITNNSGEVLGDWRDTLEKRPEQTIADVCSEVTEENRHKEVFEPFFSVEDAATAKQPAPKGSGKPILGMVLADLTNRALEGKEKYGEPLLAHNGRNPLWDAYQEALDLAMYLRQAIEEQK